MQSLINFNYNSADINAYLNIVLAFPERFDILGSNISSIFLQNNLLQVQNNQIYDTEGEQI